MTTLEMDAVISADGHVLLSHEPFLSSEICRTPEGADIPEDEALSYNLYEMPYDSIRQYDCGLKPHSRFPQQEKAAAYKPLLSEVIRDAEAYAREKGYPLPLYNVETKSNPQTDGSFHPAPDVFAEQVYDVLKAEGVLERSTVQSFDVRTLQYLHERRPETKLVLLVENEDGPQANIDRLGFVPEVYSPDFKLVNESLVTFCDDKGMKCIPWTVNETEDMRRLIRLGVDGLITDYPDRKSAALP